MKEEQIYILIHKYLNGEATDNEKKLLQDWINSSEDNEKLFSGYKKLWESTDPPQPPEKFDVEKGWEKLSEAVTLPSKSKADNIYRISAKQRTKRRKWYYLAAASLIIVALNLTVFRVFNRSDDLIVVKTKAGEHLKVELPDHSIA